VIQVEERPLRPRCPSPACRVREVGAERLNSFDSSATLCVTEPQVQIASLSSLAARNATFLLALILIGSPVAGLRPMRAARLRT
jgi:hypothetical protein